MKTIIIFVSLCIFFNCMHADLVFCDDLHKTNKSIITREVMQEYAKELKQQKSKLYAVIGISVDGITGIVIEADKASFTKNNFSDIRIFDQWFDENKIDTMQNVEVDKKMVTTSVSKTQSMLNKIHKRYNPDIILCVADRVISTSENRNQLAEELKKTNNLNLMFDEFEAEIANYISPYHRLNSVIINFNTMNTSLGYLKIDSNGKYNPVNYEIPFGVLTIDNSSPVTVEKRKNLNAKEYSKLFAQAVQDANFYTRPNIYVNGTIAKIAAIYTHPEKVKETTVEMSYKDLLRFRQGVQQRGLEYFPDLIGMSRSSAQEALFEIGMISSGNQASELLAGIDLLISTIDSLSAQNKKIIFPRKPSDWLLGYLVSNANAIIK